MKFLDLLHIADIIDDIILIWEILKIYDHAIFHNFSEISLSASTTGKPLGHYPV